MPGFLNALLTLCQPFQFGLLALGTSLGVMIGAIPGLTGAMLIALTLPLTFAMSGENALILLVSMYVGSISGGLITATLLRIPGTPASIMTTLDGYPLASSGQPGKALSLGIMASFVGGMVSWIFLVLLSQPMADLSIRLGPFEFFSLVLMALVLIASVSGESLTKGLFSGLLGMLVTIPGTAPATGELRWTFGMEELNDGFKLLPVLIGLFAVNQVIVDIRDLQSPTQRISSKIQGLWPGIALWRRHAVNMMRSSLIGTWVGILPGIGANIASVMAYTSAKSFSKTPEDFGKGSEEGIIASEAANNATVGGALIPLISLGIPGSVIDAILLGALIIHGLQPGPLLFADNPEAVYAIMATFLIANIFMFLFMLLSTRWLVRLASVPREYLIPVILVFCVVGAYALDNRMFDVWVMVAFGLLGFGLERLKIPLAPFVIGLVLAPIAEKNLGTGLMQSGGSAWPIVTRPISCLFFSVAMLLVIWPVAKRWQNRNLSKKSDSHTTSG